MDDVVHEVYLDPSARQCAWRNMSFMIEMFDDATVSSDIFCSYARPMKDAVRKAMIPLCKGVTEDIDVGYSLLKKKQANAMLFIFGKEHEKGFDVHYKATVAQSAKGFQIYNIVKTDNLCSQKHTPKSKTSCVMNTKLAFDSARRQTQQLIKEVFDPTLIGLPPLVTRTHTECLYASECVPISSSDTLFTDAPERMVYPPALLRQDGLDLTQYNSHT